MKAEESPRFTNHLIWLIEDGNEYKNSERTGDLRRAARGKPTRSQCRHFAIPVGDLLHCDNATEVASTATYRLIAVPRGTRFVVESNSGFNSVSETEEGRVLSVFLKARLPSDPFQWIIGPEPKAPFHLRLERGNSYNGEPIPAPLIRSLIFAMSKVHDIWEDLEFVIVALPVGVKPTIRSSRCGRHEQDIVVRKPMITVGPLEGAPWTLSLYRLYEPGVDPDQTQYYPDEGDLLIASAPGFVEQRWKMQNVDYVSFTA